MKVRIRRQFNDWKIGTVDFADLSGFRWDLVSGGVQAVAPQPFIHAYVWCDAIEGDFSHSGIHGPCPHHIKVVIVKKDNTPEAWQEIFEEAGPRPPGAKRYKPDEDAKEIVKALIEGTDHPAIERKHCYYLIRTRKMPEIRYSSKMTAYKKNARLRLKIQELMASHPDFELVKYGGYLAYEKKK